MMMFWSLDGDIAGPATFVIGVEGHNVICEEGGAPIDLHVDS